jgi:FMN reductase
MTFRPFIVGIGGTSRVGSTTERALRVALNEAQAAGADTEIICGADLELPMYQPDRTSRSRSANSLVGLVQRADGLIIASPGYHGSVSGLIKNALDYIEDLRDDSRVYLDGRAVGCISCAHGWNAAAQTLSTLRSIVHALRGWPTPFGAILNSSMKLFDAEGRWLDAPSRQQLSILASQVVQFASMTRLLQQVA